MLTKKRVGIAIGVVAGLGLAYLLGLFLILYAAELDFTPVFEAIEQANDQARAVAQQVIDEAQLERESN